MTTEPFVLQLADSFIDPISFQRAPHTISRLAVLKDRTTAPVLHLLAIRKFQKWSGDFFPFWVDGNPENETLQNVALAPRVLRTHRKLNIPKGLSYRRLWRAANRERVRRYAREAHLRRLLRAALAEQV